MYRSRLVAKEFKKGSQQEPELFAATPPTECLKMVLSKLATKGKDYKLLYLDVSRAFFYAKALPDEDIEAGDEHRCGKLLMSMYGTRDAAINWHHEYVDALESLGMKKVSCKPLLVLSCTVGPLCMCTR